MTEKKMALHSTATYDGDDLDMLEVDLSPLIDPSLHAWFFEWDTDALIMRIRRKAEHFESKPDWRV